MIGSSLVLIAIAVLFLHNQIKPIERLAYAAESFGKGRNVSEFKAYGAAEVRRAATGLHADARAHRAFRAAAHRHAGRHQPRSEDTP